MEITDEMIEKKFFNLNPVGMLSTVIHVVRMKLANASDFKVDGVDLTLEILADKYSRYIDFHKRKYGDSEKFVPKAEKLMEPYDYVDKNGFYIKHGTAKTGRDRYLFGNDDEGDLRYSLNILLDKFGIKNKKPSKSIHAEISNHGSETHPTTENFEITDPDW